MTRDETLSMLNFMVDSIPGMFLRPDKAVGAWYPIMQKYERTEAWGAIEYFMANSDNIPTVNGLKGYMDRRRAEARKIEDGDKLEKEYSKAGDSFAGVDGKSRGMKVIRVCAEQAAMRYKNGEKDNDFFRDILFNAKQLGIEFGFVDYESIHPTGDSSMFLKIIRDSNLR